MAIKDTTVFVKVGLVVTIVALIVQIIGYSTDFWESYDRPLALYKYSYNQGLWRLCTSTNYTEGCMDIPQSASTIELKTTRAFETLAFIFGFASIVLQLLSIFVKQKKIITILINGSSFCAGLLVFIGIIVFATDKPTGYEYGYSFALTIVGGVLYVLAGLILIVDVQKTTTTSS
ncbi:hypothetical protein LOTGIDRAFT_169803 [Lottia gigantea]|uniref:Uncharacterized protein n=1 Tax=Lottia gigantea TaxID=225164 RepID=V3YY01_LOTGI|nr:hypothetical protein LOTGIDRAFT_169803 [Lottia gigantea]ESO82978.1 hypothetical protein LOTGIDRAFT_169803 [Lottia gigantea]